MKVNELIVALQKASNQDEVVYISFEGTFVDIKSVDVEEGPVVIEMEE